MDNIKEALAKLLSDSDPAERRFAAEELSNAQGFAPIAALAAALRDENKGVRDAATRSLEQIGNENVARAVVEYLADRNIITRNLAADLLMRLKDHSINALLPYLYDADHDVRKFVVDILGGIGSEEAVTHLITTLEDSDINVVVSAAEALGNVKSVRAVPDLIRLFHRMNDAKPIAAEALGKIGGIQAEDFLSHQIGEILSIKPIDNLLLYAVYEALGKIGTGFSVPWIQQSLQLVNEKLKNIALHAIIQISMRVKLDIESTAAFKQELAAMLSDSNAAVQISAVTELSKIKDAECTKKLFQLIGKNEELDAVIFSLLEKRDTILEDILYSICNNTEPPNSSIIAFVAKAARSLVISNYAGGRLDALQQLTSNGFSRIASQWQSASNQTREVIVDALFKLDSNKAFEFFTTLAGEADSWSKMQILEFIAKIENHKVTEYVSRFLNDEDDNVRELAAAILDSKELPAGQAEREW